MDDESDCTLFVGDLSKEVTRDDLYALFAHCGEVAEAVVKCSKVTGQPMGYGFVRMATRDGAERSMMNLAGMDVKGRCIRVGRAERNCRLIVKNLDRSASTDDLIYIFMQYGPLHMNDTGHEVSGNIINSVLYSLDNYLLYLVNGYTARILHFMSRQDAERAKRDLHLQMFFGRQMHVEWYRHTPGSDPLGGDDDSSSRTEPVVSIHVRFMAMEVSGQLRICHVDS
jgi:RNA recognition motif-containing protein